MSEKHDDGVGSTSADHENHEDHEDHEDLAHRTTARIKDRMGEARHWGEQHLGAVREKLHSLKK